MLKWIFDIVLIIIISSLFYLNQIVITPKVIYLPTGSIHKIITHLSRYHYNINKIDSFFIRFIGSPQSGWINLQSEKLTKADFLYKLTTSKAPLVDIILVPGETTYIFLHQLSKQLHLDYAKLDYQFHKQTYIEEGAFVPDTYKIPIGITEKRLIHILLDSSLSKMKQFSNKIFGSFNKKRWFQYVAVASIIQKESGNFKEMPIISSVIYNRIKKGMKLQMDGTLNYGKYSHIKVTPTRIRDDRSIYNTYKHKGIPNIPICNVSFTAIKAAIFPSKTKYLYFMKSKNHTHNFTSNYSTHLYNIRNATKRNKK